MRKSGDRSTSDRKILKGDRRPVVKKHEHIHDEQKDDEIDVLL